MILFGILTGVGASLGLLRIARQDSGRWLNPALGVLATALLGARLGYVLANLGYFVAQPLEIPQFWLGGLSAAGALAGGLAGVGLVAWVLETPVMRVADQLYPLLPPLSVSLWLGAWTAGVAYGPAAPQGAWWGLPAPEESGRVLLRWPIQPLAAAALMVFFWLLETRTLLPRPAGWIFSLAGAWLALVQLVISLLRADAAPRWGGLRLDTWAYIGLALIFLALFTRAQIQSRRLSRSRVQATPSHP